MTTLGNINTGGEASADPYGGAKSGQPLLPQEYATAHWPARPGRSAGRFTIEEALRERVKELNCFYGIMETVDRHAEDVPAILRSIAGLLPKAMRWPDLARARVVLDGASYTSQPWRRTDHRLTCPLMVSGLHAGAVEVCYEGDPPEADIGPFLADEQRLVRAVAERAGRIVERVRAHRRQLDVERAACQHKSTALAEVLGRIDEEKRELREAIARHVENVVLPIVDAIEQALAPEDRQYAEVLAESLRQMVGADVASAGEVFAKLSPAESQLCQLIRRGLTNKEIARLRHISPATVRKHREHIRRKLGLTGQDVNLTSYLQQKLGPEGTHDT